MGLEDYIRARTDQYYPSNAREDRIDRIHSPRQQQRAQANDRFALANGFPPSRFMRPLPLPFMETQQQQHQNNLQLAQQQQEKSIFDTDVENVDDSTITVTSVGDIEARDHVHIHTHTRGGLFDNDVISQDWDGSEPSESEHHQENQIEVATVKNHRRKSTIPSTLDNNTRYDDEYDSRPYDWILQSETAQRPSTALNNRSKRNSLADKPSASRIPRAKSRMSLQRSDSDPGARARSQTATEKEAATTTRTVQVPTPGSGYRRMSNFPQNLTTTPNNRFNFKSERPYERLIQQQSPTRQVSGPRPQPGRRDSASPRKHGQARQKLELASRLAKGTLDTTDDDIDDDEEETENIMDNEEDDTQASLSSIEPQSLSDTTQRKISISTISDKHRPPNLTSDYPDEILQQMDFSELEQESFDHIPNPLTNHSTFTTNIAPKIKSPPLPAPSPPAPPPSTAPASEKLDYALNALSSTPAKRQQYMSSMTITEWEDFGDELIGQVGEMLKLIKESRQARRRTTALFEAEIRRRHDETQYQSGDLDRKLAEIKQGGLGVLRGLKPGM